MLRGTLSAGAMAALLLAGCGAERAAAPLPAAARTRAPHPATAASTRRAYAFLDAMMDRYATGSTLRLVRSFDGGGVGGFSDAVTYDDALFVEALLARSEGDDAARAAIVGDALLYVQAHDPAKDGRVRAAYAPAPLTAPSRVTATDRTSDVGNMAWVGLALVQLYARTGAPRYRSGALAIATWILQNASDTRGAGGYTGGVLPNGTRITWKSTEHNLDVYAFFTALAAQTKDAAWTRRAAAARAFVASMWNAAQGRFYAGTGSDGTTPNAAFKPEDVNTWTYLAFGEPRWASAPDWDVENLAVTAGGFSGVSFCSGDRSGVWFEGTAHLADALALRGRPGDRAKARSYLADLLDAQNRGLNGDGQGIVAASKNGLSDCDGDRYFASLHVGATAWYVLAAAGTNPLRLLP